MKISRSGKFPGETRVYVGLGFRNIPILKGDSIEHSISDGNKYAHGKQQILFHKNSIMGIL